MGRPFKPNCAWCDAPRVKGITCKCRKLASYYKHRETYVAKYAAAPEEKRAYARKYQAEHYDEAVAYHREWRKANSKRANAYSVAWRERNKAKSNAAKRAWKIANPDAVKLHLHTRRTRLEGNGGKLTVPEWQGICEGQGQRCFDCGELKPLTIGHVIPVSLGGSNNYQNIIAQCQSCNSKQGRLVHPAFRDEVIVDG